MTRSHATVLGATGFTGRYVCKEIAEQLRSLGPKFTWSIASRKEEALKALRDEIEAWGCPKESLPEIVLADVSNEESLVQACLQTRCLLNCVGPYAFLGEPVIKALLKASEQLKADGLPGTDYADLCGEPNFIEKMVLKYHETATQLDVTIVHAAGFDSVPADFGVLLAKQELNRSSAKDKVYPTSIEMFFALHADREHGLGIHYATYAAAVNGFATRKQLGKLRKELYSSVLSSRNKPKPIEAGFGAGFPKRKARLGGAIVWAEDQSAYLLPFFFADPSIIRLSQALDAKLGTNVDPVTFKAWIAVPTLKILLLTLLALSLFAFLSDREWGRRFLLNHPKLCSMGLVSHEGPTQAMLDHTSFTSTFVARGHSETILKNGGPGSRMGPDEKVTVKVHGPEVGYVATPVVFVAVAKVMIQQREKLRKGTLTPAVALAETTLMEDLNKDGRVTFKRSS